MAVATHWNPTQAKSSIAQKLFSQLKTMKRGEGVTEIYCGIQENDVD